MCALCAPSARHRRRLRPSPSPAPSQPQSQPRPGLRLRLGLDRAAPRCRPLPARGSTRAAVPQLGPEHGQWPFGCSEAPAPAATRCPPTGRGLPPAARTPAVWTSPHQALSVLADADDLDAASGRVLSDQAAAQAVGAHLASFRRRFPDSQPERVLRALIAPKSRAADFPLDNDALASIFYAAKELFFARRLARRVTWDWSHPACAKYTSHIAGTTALRRCARLGGWETLIVLSSPVLRDTKYNRRLLITTFLHEIIHSFMFVACGLKAAHGDGHTDGFRQIAALIDDWAGKEYLRMSDMQANLERFRGDHGPPLGPHCGPLSEPPPSLLARPPSHEAHATFAAAEGPNWLQPRSRTLHGQPLLLPPDPHHPHAAAHDDGWQWCEQETWRPGSPHSPGSPYVY